MLTSYFVDVVGYDLFVSKVYIVCLYVSVFLCVVKKAMRTDCELLGPWTCLNLHTNINSLGHSVDCELLFSTVVLSVVCQNNAEFKS